MTAAVTMPRSEHAHTPNARTIAAMFADCCIDIKKIRAAKAPRRDDE